MQTSVETSGSSCYMKVKEASTRISPQKKTRTVTYCKIYYKVIILTAREAVAAAEAVGLSAQTVLATLYFILCH